MVSINDIAKEAGVSRGTVDRVLNHRGRVSKETAQKVTDIAERLGYKKSRAGAGLAVRKKKIQIGFVYLNDLKRAPFYMQLLKWAKEEAVHLQQYGVTIHFYPFEINGSEEQEILKDSEILVRENPEIDGWALPGNFVAPVRKILDDSDLEKVPITAYNLAPADMGQTIGYVGSDYYEAGELACGLAALMSRGKGHILLTSLDEGRVDSSRDRDRGFTDAIRRYPEMEITDRVYGYGYNMFERTDSYFEKIQESIKNHSEIDTVYVMNPGDYEVVDVIHEAGKNRRIDVITNDLLSARQKEMLMDGRIAATIGQEPEKQGARPIEILFEYLAFNRLPVHQWEKTHLDVILREMDLSHAYLVM